MITPRADVAILDAPNQHNVGDSLIWLAELAYLRQLGHRVRYVADRRTYDADALRTALPPGGVVLLHGGGNSGDIWLGHQTFRERVVEDLTDYKIVQMPQSIFFQRPEHAQLADEMLGSHPDFHVLVRDSLSEARRLEQLPTLSYSRYPDMALGWDPPRRRSSTMPQGDMRFVCGLEPSSCCGSTAASRRRVTATPLCSAERCSRARHICRLSGSGPSPWFPTCTTTRASAQLPAVANPRRPVHDVVQDIANTDFVCGSSLHGMILDESLGIPVRLITSAVEPAIK